MLELGKSLRATARYEPVFYLAYKAKWANIDEAVNQLKAANLELSRHCRIPARSDSDQSARSAPVKARTSPVRKVLRKPLRGLARVAADLRRDATLVAHLARRRRFVRDLVVKERTSVVILALDVATFDTGVWVKGAHDSKKPVVVAVSCTRPFDEAVAVYSADPLYNASKPINAIAAWLFPRWRAEHQGRKFLMLPGLQVIAHELIGETPPNPWVEGSSQAEIVLAENRQFYEEGVAAGLDPSGLALTGQPVHDLLAEGLANAEERRRSLYAALGLPSGKPMILSSLIPDYGRSRPDAEFATYDELIEAWFAAVSQYPQYNHVVSLHPSASVPEMKRFERAGAKISAAGIGALIPLCDLFVTSASSAISYAIACTKPTINWDPYRYRHSMFTGAPGVIHVEARTDFENALRRLATDEHYYRQLADEQAASSPRWGLIDGRAGERIADTLDTLVAKGA